MSDLVVLCYHAVSDDWSADLSVTPAALEAQLGLLVSRGYRGATFSNAISGAAPGPTVVVTFDDAYRSVLTRAAPVLDALGLPATVFAPTDFIGRPEPMSWPGIDQWCSTAHDHELEPLSWQELEELIGRAALRSRDLGDENLDLERLDLVREDLVEDLRVGVGQAARVDVLSAERVTLQVRVAYPSDAQLLELAVAIGDQVDATAIGGEFRLRQPLLFRL